MSSSLGRLAGPLVLLAAVASSACDGQGGLDARGVQVASVLASADEPHIRSRPALVAGKYARMAAAPYDFFRGSVPLYRVDARSGTQLISVSRFGLDVPLVPSIGDPHPENFGLLRAADGSLTLEPNDFDSADRVPYLWDVRRLATGAALAALLANEDDPEARAGTAAAQRAVARAAAAGYAAGIERAARGEEAIGGVRAGEGGPIVDDLARRSEGDHRDREELEELTELAGTTRRLKRGAIEPDDPENVLAELPPFARDALPAALARYRSTLLAPPPASELQLLDAARWLGKGVASRSRVRVLLLVRGPTDAPQDDYLLELKELADAHIAVPLPPLVYHDDVGSRVLRSARSAWSRPDAEPRWGVASWLGFPCQLRLETKGQKGVSVSRMVGRLGTPEALTALATTLGRIVARVHTTDRAAPGRARTIAEAIWARIGPDRESFADEQADAAVAYSALVLDDHARFVRALDVLGTRLGVPVDAADAPSPDLALVYGAPPPPPPLPKPRP